MECNIGMVEQKARVLAGLALIGVGAYYNAKPVAALGLVPILTGMLRWCPINAALGYSSCHHSDTTRHGK
ncbi:MAG: DUF2892 domain-containing protein [Pontibacter sp.]|nr:DUF2892 domain-containing protein [Pontibacter sp.]